MRAVRFLVEKEFRQIRRNPLMVRMLVLLPIMQLMILGHAATFEIHEARLHLIDEDGGPLARRLVQHLEASGHFVVAGQSATAAGGDEALLARTADAVLHLPPDFERTLRTRGTVDVQLLLNAEDGATAGVVSAYATQIVARYNAELVREGRLQVQLAHLPPRIDLRPQGWYNPTLDYHHYMVPGILVVLVTMIGAILSALNIAREKEIGTIEQLNVTPLRKHEFLIGKLAPFWIIALVELALGLTVAKLVFDIPLRGSVPLVFALAGLYLLVMLGIGLLISTTAETQQQALFVAYFLLVVFMLLSGLFTPLSAMPDWAQTLALFNPIAHFVALMRAVLVRGAGLAAVQPHVGALALYAAAVLPLAAWRYRKVHA